MEGERGREGGRERGGGEKEGRREKGRGREGGRVWESMGEEEGGKESESEGKRKRGRGRKGERKRGRGREGRSMEGEAWREREGERGEGENKWDRRTRNSVGTLLSLIRFRSIWTQMVQNSSVCVLRWVMRVISSVKVKLQDIMRSKPVEFRLLFVH